MKYRKRPVVIEAIQYAGKSNCRECHEFLGYEHHASECGGVEILIETLEGTMTASVGDWIIKGIKGEFYPCKPDIFAATYEPAE